MIRIFCYGDSKSSHRSLRSDSIASLRVLKSLRDTFLMKIAILIALILFYRSGINKISFSLLGFSLHSRAPCSLEFLDRLNHTKCGTRFKHIFITRYEQRRDSSNQSSVIGGWIIVQFPIFSLRSKHSLMCLLW